MKTVFRLAVGFSLIGCAWLAIRFFFATPKEIGPHGSKVSLSTNQATDMRTSKAWATTNEAIIPQEGEEMFGASRQYAHIVESVEEAIANIEKTELLRKTEVIGFLSLVTNFFRTSQELLRSDEAVANNLYKVRGAMYTDNATGDSFLCTFVAESDEIRTIQHRIGPRNLGGKTLTLYPGARIKSYVVYPAMATAKTPSTAPQVIGFYPNGSPHYLNVAISSDQFFSASLAPNGTVIRQKIMDASKMTGEEWRR